MQTISCYVHHTKKLFSRFDIIDTSVESMTSYMLSVWGYIALKNTWVSLSHEISQYLNFCSDPLTYDPIGQRKNSR